MTPGASAKVIFALVLFGSAGVSSGTKPLVAPAVAQAPESLRDAKIRKEIEKIGVEISKFKEEIEQLKAQNSPIGRFASYAGVMGGIVGSVLTIVIAIIGYLIPRRLNAARIEQMRQDKELARERSSLDLFRDLASPKEPLRLAAAAVLIQRLSVQDAALPQGERKTMVDVLVAALKEKPGRDADDIAPSLVGKYIADNIVNALNAVVPQGPEEEKRWFASASASPLEKYDWQEVQLAKVWWKRVDARGVDFFEASFRQAGLAEAFLQKSIFLNASLHGAVLRGAHLEGADLRGTDLRKANLQGAFLSNAKLAGANLSGADLTGADLTGADLSDAQLDGIRFDGKTKWPTDFQVPSSGPLEPV